MSPSIHNIDEFFRATPKSQLLLRGKILITRSIIHGLNKLVVEISCVFQNLRPSSFTAAAAVFA